MHPFLAALLVLPLTAEPAPPSIAPGFDVSANAFPTLAADEVKPEEYGKWHGSVSIGLELADGNTERQAFSLTGKAGNRRERDRITLDLLGKYVDEDDEFESRRIYGSGKYDYFVSKKLYFLGQVSGENDSKATLDLRMIYAVGAGYQFVEKDTWKLAGEAGLSYIDEDYEDDLADADYLAARLGHNAEWKPSEAWTFGQTGAIYPSLEDSEDVNARVDTQARVTLTERLFAQLQWIYAWDNTPASGAHHVDHLLLLTLGWSF